MTDETRAKFLAAIAERVGADRLEEAHLFQPLRHGGVESGVAVVAVRREAPHADPLAAEDRSAENRSADRLTVYTAKYRLTIKGPERGKWEFAIQAEADAPLVTVDAVVRGVQRRSGDVDEPAKLSGDEFRALLSGAAA